MQTQKETLKKDIKSMLPVEIESELNALGEKDFRAKQIFRWLSRTVKEFSQMTDISAALSHKLDERFYITAPEIASRLISEKDGTVKYLWKLGDGHAVESVLMSYEHGNTACISSQVGCRMSCVFCASAGAGLVRNLSASEMLDQVMFSAAECGKPVSNVVLMGIGEPLDNLENVLRFLNIINNPDGMGIGMRHISLSTCGIVEGIDKLAENNLQLTLSISLHAPDNETRSTLMPVNRKYPVEALMAACKRYYQITGRRISFEYALIKGINDRVWQAERLASLMKNVHGHINLIRLNNIENSPLKPGDTAEFSRLLKKHGVNVTIRRRLGADIEAACGQLRRKAEGKEIIV
ncbi:MAG: 23S rRNA (adenine(2503)-C(2))-methyltransferase RlmN [Clostridiales bacterium]|nr:23S rRNA (adenine(2503)-C(2))-methyltransferase RlmN [Clostridiales bacterium]